MENDDLKYKVTRFARDNNLAKKTKNYMNYLKFTLK